MGAPKKRKDYGTIQMLFSNITIAKFDFSLLLLVQLLFLVFFALFSYQFFAFFIALCLVIALPTIAIDALKNDSKMISVTLCYHNIGEKKKFIESNFFLILGAPIIFSLTVHFIRKMIFQIVTLSENYDLEV